MQRSKLLGRAWTRWRIATLGDGLRTLAEDQLERSALRVSVRNETLNGSLVDDMDYVERADDSSKPPASKCQMMRPLLKWRLLRKMRLQRAYLHWKSEFIQSTLQSTLAANQSFVSKLMRRQALKVLNSLCFQLQKREVGTFFR